MCWMVAISCKAYEVDGIGTVLFLIPLGTESSSPFQPGGEDLVLEQKLYKQAVRNLTMLSWEILHVWSLVREFDGKAAHHKLSLGDDKMAQPCLSGAELWVRCWALPAGVHQCQQGEGTDPLSKVRALIMYRKGDHTKSFENSNIFPPFCLFMSVFHMIILFLIH